MQTSPDLMAEASARSNSRSSSTGKLTLEEVEEREEALLHVVAAGLGTDVSTLPMHLQPAEVVKMVTNQAKEHKVWVWVWVRMWADAALVRGVHGVCGDEAALLCSLLLFITECLFWESDEGQ